MAALVSPQDLAMAEASLGSNGELMSAGVLFLSVGAELVWRGGLDAVPLTLCLHSSLSRHMCGSSSFLYGVSEGGVGDPGKLGGGW